MAFVRVENEGDLALVTIDNPPVNALSIGVRCGLLSAIEEVEKSPALGAVLLCAGQTFVAGADIKEFGKPLEKPITPDLIAAIEASKKPWLAALHGTVLGGGLELVLGCPYRVALAGTQFGFPEVTLGLIPGAGGTQRLPRLIGVPQAIDMVSSGRRINTNEALKIGLIDRIIEGDLRAGAVAFLKEKFPLREHPTIHRRTIPDFDQKTVHEQRAQITKRARGQIAPLEAANAIMLATTLPLNEGLKQERAIFEKLTASQQSRALRYQFFAEREAAKAPKLKGIEAKSVERVGVMGAGTMGSGIAASCLLAGLNVIIVEQNTDAAEKAGVHVLSILEEAMKRGRLPGFENFRARLKLTQDYSVLASCDLVIEAVFEDMGVKSDLFARLDKILSPQAIIATNTSYLDIDQLARASGRPGNFLGLHFFAPAQIMKLLEVVRGAKTSPETLATGIAFAKRLKKIPVIARAVEGFIGNRIWQVYRREIEYMVEDGASPYEIDAAMEEMGFALGPFAVADLSGLDIAWAQRKRRAATRPADERYVRIPDLLCEAGRLGRKTGAGWYRYDDDGKRHEDPEVEKLIARERQEKNIKPRKFAAPEIRSRVLQVIAGEGEKLLAEGVAQRASDIDVVMVAGYGYPRWRGGPMFEGGKKQ